MSRILGPEEIEKGVVALAEAIRERTAGAPIALVGIRSRGDEVAERICNLLAGDDRELAFGMLDISLYRDDAATALPNPRIGPSDLPNSLDGVNVIVVDDVLYTGRTVRAALDALMDYGRPARIELAVLVDREGRELPIRADYVVKTLEIDSDQRVDVVSKRNGLEVIVQPKSAPTMPPEQS